MNTDRPTSAADAGRPVAFQVWRAPEPSPEFRAAVWQRIEARRGAASWLPAWMDSRLTFAGALAATVMLWLAVLQLSPQGGGTASLFNAVEPGTLTAAYAQALHGR